ncbi:hypothetical protein IQ06DRAFT_355148 [Phaeosphaeriaceae sp. SRC1lsM3a]|nr:hypothetical protein IQ06DRAFT_355148 [Stagonospora sp. SRC1lsM3a]
MLAATTFISFIIAANLLFFIFGFDAIPKVNALIKCHNKKTAGLERQLINIRVQLNKAETKLMKAEAELAHRRKHKNDTSTLVRELENMSHELLSTRTKLAEANKRHQEELAHVAELKRMIKEGKKSVGMLAEANEALKEKSEHVQTALTSKNAELKVSQDLVEELRSIKLFNHNQLATFTQQLRTATAEIEILQEKADDLQEHNDHHEQKKDQLEAKLSSERADNLDLTHQIRFKADELHILTIQLECQQAREDLLISLVEAQEEMLAQRGVGEVVERIEWVDEHDAWMRVDELSAERYVYEEVEGTQ